jgi:pimeloyl-ACP methyl ester carboxylesterase
MSHGILGSHLDGLGMVRTYVGDTYRAIAPSRHGYFASRLRSPSVAAQADAYDVLLDELNIEKAIVVGYSAGGPSAISFGLRHPGRVVALVLAASALPGSKPPTAVLRPVMRTIFGSDLLFWILQTASPRTSARMMGVPKTFPSTPAEAMTIATVRDSVFPHGPRADGAVFDMFVGNPAVNAMHLEDLDVPTLLVHAADDTFAPYANATAALPRLRRGELVTIEQGAHLFLGRENEIGEVMRAFIARAATPV